LNMTKEEFNSCLDPTPMLHWLQSNGKLSERKARLFGVACCRRAWALLTDPRSKNAVEIAEQFADRLVTVEELAQSLGLAWRAYHDFEKAWVHSPTLVADEGLHACMMAAEAVGWITNDYDPRLPQVIEGRSRIELVLPVVVEAARLARRAIGGQGQGVEWTEQAAQADLLRDIFGNPFRPLAIDPSLLTPQIVGLATTIYNDRAFDLMPALGAALSDAGCLDTSILEHCANEGPHCRGCWVHDFLLNRG
jgi:hypothetical protein